MSNKRLIIGLIIFLILGTIPLALGTSDETDLSNINTSPFSLNNSKETGQRSVSTSSFSSGISNETELNASCETGQRKVTAITGPVRQSKTAVAAVARTPTNVDAFWIDDNGRIWTNSFNQNNWGHATSITPADVAQSNAGIAAVARTPNNMNVFWIDPDGGIRTISWSSGSWSMQQKITPAGVAQSNGAVTAVARTPSEVHVFWIGTDGLIWTTQGTVSSGTELTWSLESSISTADSSARTDGVVAAVARTPNIVNIFWIGNDGDIWIKKWASGTWGAHVPVFRSRVADPAAGISAVALTSNEVHIFYISNINGFNGVIDTQFPIRRDGIFAILSFFPVTGRDASQPDALVASDSRSPQTRSVFWIDNDGGIWTRTWTSGRWNDQTQIAGRESTLQGTGVTVSDRSSLISDLFWKGTDGRSVFTSSFRNNVWSSPVKIS